MDRIIEVESGRIVLKLAEIEGSLYISAKSAGKIIKKFSCAPSISGVLIMSGVTLLLENEFFYLFDDFAASLLDPDAIKLLMDFKANLLENAGQP